MNSAQKRIEAYLADFKAGLKGLPAADRNEFVSEISAHIRDSVEAGRSIDDVLSQLGPAKELAAQYREALWLDRASRTISPWFMLQGVFWLAKTSALGFICFVVALIGYVTGSGMIFTALLKPFMPQQVGLWVGPGVFDFGIRVAGKMQGGAGMAMAIAPNSQVHDVLGSWYIPVALTIGSLFLLGTTVVLRKLLRKMKTKSSGPALPGRNTRTAVAY